jgi:putative tricarboxylic transport membrane protein
VSDRIFGLTLTIVALAFFASATVLESPFFADPLGPKTFPYLISTASLLCTLAIIIFPDKEPSWPTFKTFRKLISAFFVLIFYAYSLKPFGFLVPTAIASAILSFQISPKISSSLVTGVSLSIALFFIFKFGLGLSLFALPTFFYR